MNKRRTSFGLGVLLLSGLLLSVTPVPAVGFAVLQSLPQWLSLTSSTTNEEAGVGDEVRLFSKSEHDERNSFTEEKQAETSGRQDVFPEIGAGVPSFDRVLQAGWKMVGKQTATYMDFVIELVGPDEYKGSIRYDWCRGDTWVQEYFSESIARSFCELYARYDVVRKLVWHAKFVDVFWDDRASVKTMLEGLFDTALGWYNQQGLFWRELRTILDGFGDMVNTVGRAETIVVNLGVFVTTPILLLCTAFQFFICVEIWILLHTPCMVVFKLGKTAIDVAFKPVKTVIKAVFKLGKTAIQAMCNLGKTVVGIVLQLRKCVVATVCKLGEFALTALDALADMKARHERSTDLAMAIIFVLLITCSFGLKMFIFIFKSQYGPECWPILDDIANFSDIWSFRLLMAFMPVLVFDTLVVILELPAHQPPPRVVDQQLLASQPLAQWGLAFTGAAPAA